MSEGSSALARLTPEQRLALTVRDSSVALGAGAGCGKTMVLTERFLDEIQGDSGRPLRALVALTFTEKAARELRQRIRVRCREKLAEGEDARRWRSALKALEAAPIGTFHQFCTRLLRAHATEAGVDPEFVILEESIAASLRDEAVRRGLRRLLADRERELMELGRDHGLGRVREMLTQLLANRSVGELEAWSGLTPQAVIERWMAVWTQSGRSAVLGVLAPVARRTREVLERIDASHPTLGGRRDELLVRLGSLESGTCTDDMLEEVMGLARVSDLRARGIWASERDQQAVKSAFEVLRRKIGDVCKRLVFDPGQTLASAEESLRLIRLVSIVKQEYERIKERRRGLDFDDLLVATRTLLRRRAELSSGFMADSEGIEFVLIDEFQDTDRVQSEILRLMGEGDFFRGRIFVVGDAKQSIYRFRGAEPSVFGQWRSEFDLSGRLALTENFRSVPGVIDFVNALFRDCFSEVEGSEPSEASVALLRPRRTEVVEEPAVTFHWAVPSAPEDESDVPSRRPSAEEKRLNEARSLARWLRTRLDEGWIVLDRATRVPRAAQAGDVAFLFRAMTEVWPYETALADEGFEYHTIGGSAFYVQQEIRDVVCVLSVIEDPCDEVALAGALRSPFFSLSDDGLFWLARTFRGGLTQGLERYAEIDELNDRDRRAAGRAMDLLTRWRAMKDHVPLARLTSAVLDESGFEAALVCEPLGSRKVANTRKLVRLARQFDQQGNFGLADLVGRLRADLRHPPREEQAATTDEAGGSVLLMSIHQAKGLEFPIVVIPDLNRQPNVSDPPLGIHPELGLVVRPSSSGLARSEDGDGSLAEQSLGWSAFRAIEAEEERKESLRLFYVATTRARDHLILSAGLEAEERATEETESASSCSDNVTRSTPRAVSTAFQLLLERFDWRTGQCVVNRPGEMPQPRVRVLMHNPPEARSRRPRASLRQRLEEIEHTITRTPVSESEVPSAARMFPRMVDLDPQRSGNSASRRLGSLARALLADGQLLRGDRLELVAARCGARQVPCAGSMLVRETVARLDSWTDSSLFQELRQAARHVKALDRAARWVFDHHSDTIGRTLTLRVVCDVTYRDRKGSWRPVVLSVDPEDAALDRLRLSLSLLALDRFGPEPAGAGWWIQTLADGRMQVEPVLPPALSALDRDLIAWLEREASEAG
jgi:ATP-dependent helicase/nuclease subunit A